MAINRKDLAHEYTDKQIEIIERRLAKMYRESSNESRKKMQEHFAAFEKRDKEMLKKVKAGELTEKEYKQWRLNQIAMGQRWDAISKQLADDYYKTDVAAREMVRNNAPKVYAENYNYNTYTIETQIGYDTSFTMYSEDAVRELIKEKPNLIYDPDNAVSQELFKAKNQAYHLRRIQSETTKAIMLGTGINDLARNIAKSIGISDMASATAYARTMMTRAQNMGRLASQERAKAMGIECRRQWIATMDMRTRHSHAIMDGEYEDEDGKFSNGLRFPGDTESGDPSEYMNCRCTTIDEVDGIAYDMFFRSTEELKGMSYDEWKEYHKKKNMSEKEQKKKGGVNKPKNMVNLRSAYEYHRTKNNLRVVPFDDLKESFFQNDLSKLSPESQRIVSKSVNRLIGKYDTRLQGVGMFSAKEALSTVYAYVQSDYSYDKAVMFINPLKCKKKTALVETMAERKKQRYIPKIPSDKLDEYIITHEFGHTLINMGEKLNNKTNWVGADYAKVKRVRKEINTVYESYTKEVSRLEKIKKSEEMKVILGEKDMSISKAKQAAKEYDEILISKYSMSNADEFMADSFALCELGGDNPYAREVYKILLREFGR